jgi:hypothetical protein
MLNLVQLDIRCAFENDYVVQAPPVPPMNNRPNNLVIYYADAPTPTTSIEQARLYTNLSVKKFSIYDDLVLLFKDHLRRPDSPKKLDNPYLIDEEVREALKVAMSENKLSSKQIVELNKFCAMKKEQTFLYTLVGQNKIKAIQVFVGFPGINVNKGTYQGETPLMLACEDEERFPLAPPIDPLPCPSSFNAGAPSIAPPARVCACKYTYLCERERARERECVIIIPCNNPATNLQQPSL